MRKPSFYLSLNFFNFPEIEPEIFLNFSYLLLKYTFVINIVNLNLNSIFKILNVITAKYQILTNKNTKFWELSLVIFLRFS